MRLSTALISLTLATALASPAFAAGTMQMSGHGEIMAKPDTAYVNSGVTSQAATAKDALAANTADMTALIGVLKDAGVARLSYFSDEKARVFQELKAIGRAIGMPTSVLIDANGCEIGTMADPAEWASDDGVALIKAALAGEQAKS